MDSFVDMLWDQDVDMGVDRYFYDPVLREQHVKKQEAEQNKLQELKKRHAQQETKRFIIDEETGERIPDPSASSRSLCTFSEETDLSKELVELAELDYLLGDMQAPDMSCQMKQVQQNNIPLIQPQQANYNSADMIVQTADQPNIPPDVDLWPTEITMLPGPSQAHPSTVHQLPYPTADTNPFISQIWGMEADTGCSTSVKQWWSPINSSVLVKQWWSPINSSVLVKQWWSPINSSVLVKQVLWTCWRSYSGHSPQFQSYEADTNDNIYHASTSPSSVLLIVILECLSKTHFWIPYLMRMAVSSPLPLAMKT
ncbi:hypothetical protein EB796_012336 [Bugula neritina]|uniref:NFE2L2 n=1 Tax=Bugula neritina TaxID=10212 RepID=A0A7J7JTX4_BUGNE|nr:hypothetical protein EB796_012336 [Bugula neritina]